MPAEARSDPMQHVFASTDERRLRTATVKLKPMIVQAPCGRIYDPPCSSKRAGDFVLGAAQWLFTHLCEILRSILLFFPIGKYSDLLLVSEFALKHAKQVTRTIRHTLLLSLSMKYAVACITSAACVELWYGLSW